MEYNILQENLLMQVNGLKQVITNLRRNYATRIRSVIEFPILNSSPKSYWVFKYYFFIGSALEIAD